MPFMMTTPPPWSPSPCRGLIARGQAKGHHQVLYQGPGGQRRKEGQVRMPARAADARERELAGISTTAVGLGLHLLQAWPHSRPRRHRQVISWVGQPPSITHRAEFRA